MKYNILGYISLVFCVFSIVLFFSGSNYTNTSIWVLLFSALLGSFSLYINDKKVENRKMSAGRMVSMATLIILFIVVIIFIFAFAIGVNIT